MHCQERFNQLLLELRSEFETLMRTQKNCMSGNHAMSNTAERAEDEFPTQREIKVNDDAVGAEILVHTGGCTPATVPPRFPPYRHLGLPDWGLQEVREYDQPEW